MRLERDELPFESFAFRRWLAKRLSHSLTSRKNKAVVYYFRSYTFLNTVSSLVILNRPPMQKAVRPGIAMSCTAYALFIIKFMGNLWGRVFRSEQPVSRCKKLYCANT